MTSYDYLIVGAGVAAASAVKGIRAVDQNGSIGILGAEPDPPVYRPDLSKDLWLKDDATLEGNSLAGDLEDDDRVDLVTDTTVTAIDPDAHAVRLADGTSVATIEDMARKLLANTVIETFKVETA